MKKKVIATIIIFFIIVTLVYVANGIFYRGTGKVSILMSEGGEWKYEDNKLKITISSSRDQGAKMLFDNKETLGEWDYHITHSNFFFIPDSICVSSTKKDVAVEIWNAKIKVQGDNIVIYNIKNEKMKSKDKECEKETISNNVKKIVLVKL